MAFDDIAKLIGIVAIVFGLGVLVGIAIGKNDAKESYCTKYTNSVQEYKACKASNLVEFIEKEAK